MNVFGKRSKEQYDTCHKDLQLILNIAIKVSSVDFGLSEGHRTFNKQLEYFFNGASKIDPRNPELAKKGMHLYNPSLAVDFYVYVAGKNYTYDKDHLIYIATVIQTVANILYNEGKISHLIRWGGNWDKDGIIIKDQSFQDLCHVELYTPKK